MAKKPDIKDADQPIRESVSEELRALRREVSRLNKHRFIKVHNSVPRLLWFQFTRGLAFGLGSVLGATFLVSIVVYSLSQIDFIPIIGDWAKEIADQIQLGSSTQ